MRLRTGFGLLAVLVLVAQSAGVGQAPRWWNVRDAPADYRPAAERALRAFDSVQATLSRRLVEEMKAGGPTRAIAVCRDEAQSLTQQVARESAIDLGRTGVRLRNAANAPREWVKPFLERSAGAKAATVQPMVVDLGDRVGVLRPIGTAGSCTTCHGAREKQPSALRQLLAKYYPHDEAVGFVEGDLRGFFWAEVKR